MRTARFWEKSLKLTVKIRDLGEDDPSIFQNPGDAPSPGSNPPHISLSADPIDLKDI
jgi:hypothetical protein